MPKRVPINPGLPPQVGPYSPAILSGDFLFVSGQIGVNEKGELTSELTEEQTLQALKNLKALLASSGFSLEEVCKTTIFLLDMGEFSKVNEVYTRFFQPPFPARSTVSVCALPKGARVEIEAIAMKEEGNGNCTRVSGV